MTKIYDWPSRFDDYYHALGHCWVLDLKGKKLAPSTAILRGRWRKRLTQNHPLALGLDGEMVTTDFRAIMEAWLTLSSPLRTAYDDAGHAAWIASARREPYLSAPIPDWQHLLIDDALAVIETERIHYEELDQRRSHCVAPHLSLLPKYLAAERLRSIDLLNLAEMISELAEDHPRDIDNFRIEWTWRRNLWGTWETAGQAKAYPDAVRLRHPKGPHVAAHGRIELALDHWIALDEEGRRRLVWHELLHFYNDRGRLKVRPHAVEAFPEEVTEFGICTPQLARLAMAILAVPKKQRTRQIREQLPAWEAEQLGLFAAAK